MDASKQVQQLIISAQQYYKQVQNLFNTQQLEQALLDLENAESKLQSTENAIGESEKEMYEYQVRELKNDVTHLIRSVREG